MYIGRFAPSPTGPLHFGSLVAAVASYLEARIHQGRWLVRMEDVDKPREMPGAAANILNTLSEFGFEWDGEVVYQSQRESDYQRAFEILKSNALVYACSCSRKEIADSANHGIEGLVYPGTCRNKHHQTAERLAWRVKVNADLIEFDDAIQGHQLQQLSQDIGDFVLKRSDGFFAYQLAVVVDDALQKVTHIVRGADLLASTPRQIYLQRLLGYTQPQYAHLPLVTNQNGEKLSKQTLAAPIEIHDAKAQLWFALDFLNQQPPLSLKTSSLSTLWQWALENWRLGNINPHNAMATAYK
ncbi:MAG: tRNA glutamyl-Q(34) synthetase GluQRS [Methylotenera sp.]|nr:MAG: tRNA glutamyl-Q(34) synthetase GluQRS [Methylotenera sp.]